MRQHPVRQLVDTGGAAWAGGIPVRVEHDVLNDQLTASPEHRGQPDLAVWSVQQIFLADLDHRQPPPPTAYLSDRLTTTDNV